MILSYTLRERGPYPEFFWSVFSHISPYSVSFRIQSEYRKMRTRKATITDTFQLVTDFPRTIISHDTWKWKKLL